MVRNHPDTRRTYRSPIYSPTIDGNEDFDNDTLRTKLESNLTTDPFDEDTDGDRLLDPFEYEYEYDTLSVVDPDTDGDGLRDGFEVLESEADPLDTDSDGDNTTDDLEDHDGDDLVNAREQSRAGVRGAGCVQTVIVDSSIEPCILGADRREGDCEFTAEPFYRLGVRRLVASGRNTTVRTATSNDRRASFASTTSTRACVSGWMRFIYIGRWSSFSVQRCAGWRWSSSSTTGSSGPMNVSKKRWGQVSRRSVSRITRFSALRCQSGRGRTSSCSSTGYSVAASVSQTAAGGTRRLPPAVGVGVSTVTVARTV